MPAIYAHYSFGKKVYRQMPVSVKKIVRKYSRKRLVTASFIIKYLFLGWIGKQCFLFETHFDRQNLR